MPSSSASSCPWNPQPPCQCFASIGSSTKPYVRKVTVFLPPDCIPHSDSGDNHSGANSTCRTVLNTTVFESTSLSNASYIVPYTLLKLNHSDAGLYTCQVELHECSTLPDGVRVINSLPITVRLYTKPDYGVHLGIISAACVILVALLAGLYTYVKKIHGRSKSRYQELLSTVDIQYLPTKVKHIIKI